MRHILISARMILILTLLTGIIYPLFVTFVARISFRDKAEGSQIRENGKVIGSALIGQAFTGKTYFHPRPSATDYQALPSGASNLSWTDKRLQAQVLARKNAFIAENNLPDTTTVPAEMLFTSASGLDPHISPGTALLQVRRIAEARGFNDSLTIQLNDLVGQMTEPPQYSLFGEARVNVVLLNLELDKIK